MKNDLTEIVFILDRSGSMSGLEKDTIGGFNSMLSKQREAADDQTGKAVVTTVLFDDQYELLHDRIPLEGVKPISGKEYYVRGSTALLDAVGKTIQKIVNVQRNTAEAERPGKVIFVITTDGFENASREYHYSDIKKMIQKQTQKYHWEFIFLGANIDAAKEAGKFGIDTSRAVQYHNDAQGVMLNYDVVGEAVLNVREGKKLTKAWKQRIEDDFEGR